MNPGDGERNWTVAELAEAMRVNDQTVRRWVADGRLPHDRDDDGFISIKDTVAQAVLRGEEPPDD